jgi:penicillin-binding protein 1A
MAPDGAVKALVGGADYKASQFNRATQARRQPGSTFKLFVLLAALEYGYKPGDRFLDAPIALGNWRPRNYRDHYLGQVSIGDAVALSLNSVAVRVSEAVGRGRVAAMAERLGIRGPVRRDPAIALGVTETSLLEMTGAFAVLANKGRAAMPYAILEIRDRKNRIVFKRRGGPGARLLRDDVVRDAHGVLHAVTTRGTARRAGLPQPAYGKTGTSQDYRDAWFVGYTSALVAGVWFGNDDRKPMKDVTGGELPARVWGAFMRAALPGANLKQLDSSQDEGPAPAARR